MVSAVSSVSVPVISPTAAASAPVKPVVVTTTTSKTTGVATTAVVGTGQKLNVKV